MTAPGSTADAYTFDDVDDPARPVAAGGVASIGAYLAAQRRLRGLSLEELEAVTRIPRRSLARLESGAFDRHQDAFVRGFVRTVALAIGLDPGETLVRMLTGQVPPQEGRVGAPARGTARALGIAALVALGLGGVLGAAGRIHLSRPEAPMEISEAEPLMRRDYVREFAREVGEATPGSFSRPAPLALPPAMYLAPVPEPAEAQAFGAASDAPLPVFPARQ